MSDALPYGTWPSPLTPAAMAAGGRRITAPLFVPTAIGPAALLWCESLPEQAGRTTIMRRDPDGVVTELLASPWDVGTRVHEYGGRAYVAWDDHLAFVHRPDQSLRWMTIGHGAPPVPMVDSPSRFAEPVFDRAYGRIIAVAETPAPGAADTQPRASLVAITPGDGTQVELRAGADFYASPVPSPDGRRLAWLEWNHPNMPWDAGAIWVADLDAEGAIVRARHVAGDRSASAQQPTWAADGTLWFLWEHGGAWAPWCEDAGGLRCGYPSPDELGGPMWNLGMRTWGFVGPGRAAAAAVHGGYARLVAIDLHAGTAETITTGADTIGHVATTVGVGVGVGVSVGEGEGADAGQIAIAEGWDGRGTALTLVDAAGAVRWRREVGLHDVLPAEAWSRAQPIRFETSADDVAHAWFYPPHLPGCRGPEGALPPLIVVAHGGPTGLALASGNLAVQFWTTRGFAVLDVNYRGSTGFGRAYRERLRGMWGVYDVDDCVAAARHVARLGWVDSARMVIRGSSAGGFTVLAALAFHDVFCAGASHYGVSDVASLVRDTHKFESHYDRFLFGDDADAELWRSRSPLHAASQIRAPVIFFQGLDDPAVPPSQTERMVEAMRASGLAAEYHAYAGEGHGFRRPENVVDAWTKEVAFYRRVLGRPDDSQS